MYSLHVYFLFTYDRMKCLYNLLAAQSCVSVCLQRDRVFSTVIFDISSRHAEDEGQEGANSPSTGTSVQLAATCGRLQKSDAWHEAPRTKSV